MDHDFAPLRSPADLERALAEARRLLPGLEQAGPAEKARFDKLVQRISEYRGSGLARDPEAERHRALDDHLKAYGRQWSRADEAGEREPWRSMVGGDVNPRRTARG
jgi:chromatin segregation and condensation protein Rec8/ScpA/Scc1 (kleisin family)